MSKSLPVTSFVCDYCNGDSTPGDAFERGWVIAAGSLSCNKCTTPEVRAEYGAASPPALIRARDELHESLGNVPRGMWTGRDAMPHAQQLGKSYSAIVSANVVARGASLFHLQSATTAQVRVIADALADDEAVELLFANLSASLGLASGGMPFGGALSWQQLDENAISVFANGPGGSHEFIVMRDGRFVHGSDDARLTAFVAALFLVLCSPELVETRTARVGRGAGLNGKRRRPGRVVTVQTVNLRGPVRTGRRGHGKGGRPLRYQAEVSEHLRQLRDGRIVVVRSHVRGKGLPPRPTPVHTL